MLYRIEEEMQILLAPEELNKTKTENYGEP